MAQEQDVFGIEEDYFDCNECGVQVAVLYLEDEDSGTAGFYCGPCGKAIGSVLNGIGHVPQVELLSS